MKKNLRIFSAVVAAVLLFNMVGIIPVFYGSGSSAPAHSTDPLMRSDTAATPGCALPEADLPAIQGGDTDESDPYDYHHLTAFFNGVFVNAGQFGSFPPNAGISRFACDVSEVHSDFSDVPGTAWFAQPVSVQETLGLMSGTGKGSFTPNGTVSLAQAVSVALRVYEKYCGLPLTESGSGANWYLPAVEKAKFFGLLNADFPDYSAPATRAQIISLLYNSLPAKEYQQINDIDRLPDMTAANADFSAVLAFYRAGILCGSDEYGAFRPESSITRAELAAILMRLVLPEHRQTVSLRPTIIETLSYGTSGSGKHPLIAYRIGGGENVMVLTFAIHGQEDNYEHDGQSLVYTAEQLNAYLKSNYALVDDNNWTVYILPCLNPDGTYEGSTCDGPGRCTLYYYDDSGKLIFGNDKGVDINRCFPYQFSKFSSSRNFNGTKPLQCPEAVALEQFVSEVRGSGANVLIDNHGWYTQILGTQRSSRIYTALHTQFPQIGSYGTLSGSTGYFSAYCGYVLGYDAALFEFPDKVYSHTEFVARGDTVRYCAAITDLLQNYDS